ncbi:AAA family ATPase [Planotetraspora sp. A-T 1434]|uniref:AfsR/SARP family transcriptional regulator n=1 Tax=Planotetraspora sp. A-T 1434 TaxID=2979219 RepID=UPI0021C01794|nr:BTAD domain-containing putative transcriptional regulator [Planotetraspora sp. A-T 1434]MCT9932853.1 AAA family ATPase [Planotetraspora sp. A-T 1434]
MRFGILGPTEARLGDERPNADPGSGPGAGPDEGAVAVGGPGLRALLALLLLGAGRVVSGERLIGGLYGADPPANAVNALQAQVSRLRRHLGDLVEGHPAGYRLAVDPDDVDAFRFERLAAEGRRALSSGNHRAAAASLRQALDLWRGPALADVLDAPFAAAQATRLEELRLTAAEDLAEARLALGEHGHHVGHGYHVGHGHHGGHGYHVGHGHHGGHGDLVAELRDRAAAHPLRERTLGQLMRALYAAGRQAEALTAFEDARRRLADELGADPSAELAAIHLAVLRSDPSLSPGPAVRHSLPAHLTTLVGRAEDLERIGALLGEARLVTLTGPGGTGKTRLATEAAGREPGTVCFVELAPLGDGTDVPQAVLAALGLRETGLLATPAPARSGPAPDPVARLVAALGDRPALLVLDNCEHVVEAAARLADRLLSACPALRVLATSREALGITGERLYPVPPLDLPPPGTPSAEALAYPAVRLFAERASAVRPDVEPGAEDIARICRALDGLPLAIELAAARMRSLTAAELAARLTDRFSLLSRGSRTAQPRHRTLRAVVEWSWDLLDETERALARRLTVFAGGATLEAAERVCGVPDTDGVLASLVEKSLVEAVVDAVGDRYRMLETIRAFCAERLAEAGEEERLHRAHLAYYLDLAETADPHLRGPEQLEWLRRLDAERDNLHAALHRAADDSDDDAAQDVVRAAGAEDGLRLLSASAGYWLLRGLRSEAAGLARELLARTGTEPPAGLAEEHALCVFTAVSGGAASGLGPGLESSLSTAIRVADGLREPPRQPYLLVLRAVVGGPPDRGAFQELESRAGVLDGDPWLNGLTDFGRGYLLLFDGRLAEADRQITASVEALRAVGDRWALTMALSAMADLADLQGDYARVEAHTNEALQLAERLGATVDVAETLCRRARGRARTGDEGGARADYERTAELARQAGAPELLGAAHLGLGEMARLRGDLREARSLYEAALAECTADWFAAEETRAQVYLALGWTAEAEGNAAEALAWHRRALTTGLGDRDVSVTARVAEGLAGVALLEGDAERAALLLGVGAALRGTSPMGDADLARVGARCRARIGDAAYDRAYARGQALTRRGPDHVALPALTVMEGHLSAFGE